MSKQTSLFPRLGNIPQTSLADIYKKQYGETDGTNPAFVRSKPNKKLSPPPSPPPLKLKSSPPPPLPLKSCIVKLYGLDPTTELNEKYSIVVGVTRDSKKYIVMPIRIFGDKHNVLPHNMIDIPLESLSYIIQKGGRKRKSHKNRYSKRSKLTKLTNRSKRTKQTKQTKQTKRKI
jgi:hypothetical protein